MTYEVRVEQRGEQEAAVVHEFVALEDIPSFVGKAFGEVGGALAQQGLFPTGPPFARYRITKGGFDIDAGFPCGGRVTAQGRVVATVLPGGDIAVTMHTGSYDGVAAAYTAVMDWLAAHGRSAVADPWEVYLDDPDVTAPRTVVCVPCSGGPA